MTADNPPNALEALGDYVGARPGLTTGNPHLIEQDVPTAAEVRDALRVEVAQLRGDLERLSQHYQGLMHECDDPICANSVEHGLRAALQQAMVEADIYRGLLIYGKPWEPKYQESWDIMKRQSDAALARAKPL